MANSITIKVTAKDMATKALKGMGQAMDNLRQVVFSLRGALGGLTLGSIARGMISTAATFENLALSLETITGSSAEAQRSMDWITKFAATTPYELEEVANAFKKLAAYGMEPTELLETLGDTASALGKSLDDAVEAVADAATGQFERLKEFGVRANATGQQVTFSWIENGRQMQKSVNKTGVAITEALGQIFSGRYAGGMARLAQGWAGMWSNLSDYFSLFVKKIMDSGVFDYAKGRLKELMETLERMDEDGSLKELARDIGVRLVSGLESLWGATKRLISLWDSLPSGTSSAVGMGIVGNLLFGPKGGAALAGGTYLLQSFSQSLEGLKRSMPGGDISFWDYMWSDRKELEALLGQADARRTAQAEAQATKEREVQEKHLAAAEAQEAEYAAKIKAIQKEVSQFRNQEWEQIERNIKDRIKNLIAEEEKYANKVKTLQEKRRLAELSTEEKVRAMLRGTMTEYEVHYDKYLEARQSLSKARAAMDKGQGEEAETWAKKAQEQFADLVGEVRDGERVIVSAAEAQATAVAGVREAGRVLSESITVQERAAESARLKVAEQAQAAKDALGSIQEVQDKLGDVEMILSVKDGATPTLAELQLAAQKLAEAKIEIGAVNNVAAAIDAAKTKAGELPESLVIDVSALDNAQQTLSQVAAQVSGLPQSAPITLTATDQATPVVQGAANTVAALPKTAAINITAEDQATGPVRWIETETGLLLTNKVFPVEAEDQATAKVQEVAAQTSELLTPKTMPVTATDQATPVVQGAANTVAALPKTAAINITAEDQATGPVRWIETETGLLLTNKVFPVEAEDQATAKVQEVAAQTSELLTPKTMPVMAEDQATPVLEDLETSVGNMPTAQKILVAVKDNATATLRSIQGQLAAIKDKTVTVTVRYRKVGSASGRADGGIIPGYAFGGQLPGYSLRDNLLGLIRGMTPIGLAGGEFVTNARSTRIISQLAPGLLEKLNQIRSSADLARVLAGVNGIQSRAMGGPVESYRFTFSAAGKEASITTSSKIEAQGLKDLAAAMQRQKLLAGY